jgi:hypothetical protein
MGYVDKIKISKRRGRTRHRGNFSMIEEKKIP